MKRIFQFLGIAILFALSCDKENAPDELTPIYFTFKGDIGTNDNSTILSNDDNLIICGNLEDKIFILKTSITGNEIWRNNFTAGNSSTVSSLTQTPNNDLFICGSTNRNYNTTKWDILLIRMNSSGDTIWTKTYGGDGYDNGRNIISTTDGNILIAGKTESFGAGTFGDIYLIKINFDGDTLWTKRFPDPDQELPFSLIETADGGYLITGSNQDDNKPVGFFLAKVSTNGKNLWNKTISEEGIWKWGHSTIELSNGDLLSCGKKNTHGGYSQLLVLKTDNQGNKIWEKEHGEDNLSELGNSLKQNKDQSFTIVGNSYNANIAKADIIALKIDHLGEKLWLNKFGSSENDWGVNLLKDINNNNIITGYYNSGFIFITKIDNEGNYK